MFYLKKIPRILQFSFPNLIWRIPNEKNIVYLSFDDGPDRVSTPKILDLLDEYDAKVSFFCLGEKADKNPDLIQEIVRRGHTLGSHGYEHIAGWGRSRKVYVENIEKTAAIFHSEYFRPPYGRIGFRQYLSLWKKYKIIMWTIMPGDFDKRLNIEKSKRFLMKKISPGDIIVLHDNVVNSKITLELLRHLLISEFTFKRINI